MNSQSYFSARDHRFFGIMSLFSFAFVVLGFGNAYALRALRADDFIPTIIHVHGGIFFAWIVAYALQTWFVFSGKTSLHIKFGKLAMLLVPALMISGFMTAVDAAKAGHVGIPGLIFPSWQGFLMLNLNSLFIFCAFAAAGWFFRDESSTHKRLMLMATVVGLAPPAISRLPLIAGNTPLVAALVMLFVLACPAYDLLAHKRIHRVYHLTLPFVVFILPPVVTLLSGTQVWVNLASVII